MANDTETLLTTILHRLDDLEICLRANKDVLNFEEFCQYTGTSRRYAYRLTSENRVPHYKPHGKKIFFKRAEVDGWLTQGRVSTVDEVDQQATSHVIKRGTIA